MAVKLFSQRNVPDDEIEEIRELLTEHNIDFYETPGGNWGISMPAFWLREEEELTTAKALLAEYQVERAERARLELEARGPRNIWQLFWEQPVRFVAYIFLILLVAYISIAPFLSIGE